MIRSMFDATNESGQMVGLSNTFRREGRVSLLTFSSTVSDDIECFHGKRGV